MLLDKSAFLAATEPQTEAVEIAGGSVLISALRASDYLAIYTDTQHLNDNGTINMARFVPVLMAASILNPDGSKMFTGDEIDLICSRDSETYITLSAAVKRLNGLSGDEIKNSGADRSNCSSIDSVCNSDTEAPSIWPVASPPQN